ncbi:MAG: hypothetical protein ABJE95_27600 [Byssovorax sp.]
MAVDSNVALVTGSDDVGGPAGSALWPWQAPSSADPTSSAHGVEILGGAPACSGVTGSRR